MVRRAQSTIDLDKLAHNVDEIRKLMQDTKIMAILKADAYGHGAVECARKLKECGVDFFAVAALKEAVELRKNGVDENILVLGYTAPEDFKLLEEYDLIQSVISSDYAKEINAYPGKIRTHIKLDTGMNRTGIVFDGSDEGKEELLSLYQLENLNPEGIYSHFSVADELDEENDAFTRKQKELFDQALAFLKEHNIEYGLTHLQNSYGILNYGPLGYDYCRPGLLYMGVTSDDQIPVRYPLDLQPILNLQAAIAMVKPLKKGQSVSYGRNFTADHDMKVATVTIGYADGLSRSCSNQNMSVLVHGKKVPVIGNICMDQCIVDVSDLEDVKQGDVVTLIGQDGDQSVSVDEISRLSNTINNETLSRLGSRIDRIYKGVNKSETN